MNISEVKFKLDSARQKIEEIKATRVQYQEALRNLDLNEAGWLGYIEALTPYVVEEAESNMDAVVADAPKVSRAKKQ